MAGNNQGKLKGLESSFCTEWSGWDEADTFALQFYDAVLTPEFAAVVGVPVASCLYINGDDSAVAVYDEEGEEIFTAKVKLVLDK